MLGLKGLKGTIPLLKLAGLLLVALSPILIPLKLFLGIAGIAFFLLKPVITLGVGRSVNNKLTENELDGTAWFTRYYSNSRNGLESKELFDLGLKFGREVLGREFDNHCMERIACEGVFKSMPRIFLRVLGENFRYKKLRRRRDVDKIDVIADDDIEDDITVINPRRKDLATLALTKLKNPQFLTKRHSLTDTSQDSEKTCRQYKCSLLYE